MAHVSLGVCRLLLYCGQASMMRTQKNVYSCQINFYLQGVPGVLYSLAPPSKCYQPAVVNGSKALTENF